MQNHQNASKNAGEMINKFQILFNRTRQAVITGELVEIITGAAARFVDQPHILLRSVCGLKLTFFLEKRGCLIGRVYLYAGGKKGGGKWRYGGLCV